MVDEFEKAMRLMRRRDPQQQEDGFGLLSDSAALYLPRLVEAFETEEDVGLRRWLLELIGSTGDERALDVLQRSLQDDDQSVRDWAVRGLERIDTRDARVALRRFRGEPTH